MDTIYLFVPASTPHRFAKAVATGARLLVDLEDGIHATAKTQARHQLQEWALQHPHVTFSVRLNNDADGELQADIDCLQTLLPQLDTVIVPKAESAERLQWIAQHLSAPLIPMIESVQGWHHLHALMAVPRVQTVTFGQLDLMHEMGLQRDTPELQQVMDNLRIDLLRATILHHRAPPIDTIYPHLHHETGLLTAIRHWQRLGFGGMLCIHPQQVHCVHQMQSVDTSSLEWAQQVVAHYEHTQQALFTLKGVMVDKPVIEQCYALLAQQPSPNT